MRSLHSHPRHQCQLIRRWCASWKPMTCERHAPGACLARYLARIPDRTGRWTHQRELPGHIRLQLSRWLPRAWRAKNWERRVCPQASSRLVIQIQHVFQRVDCPAKRSLMLSRTRNRRHKTGYSRKKRQNGRMAKAIRPFCLFLIRAASPQIQPSARRRRERADRHFLRDAHRVGDVTFG